MDSSSNMWGSPDEAMARVNAQVAEAQQRAERATAVRIEMDALRGKAKSPKGEVEVEVDTSGRLVGLELTSDAMDLGERELSKLIVATSRAAASKAGELAIELAADAFGQESSITARFREEITERNLKAAPVESDIKYV